MKYVPIIITLTSWRLVSESCGCQVNEVNYIFRKATLLKYSIQYNLNENEWKWINLMSEVDSACSVNVCCECLKNATCTYQGQIPTFISEMCHCERRQHVSLPRHLNTKCLCHGRVKVGRVHPTQPGLLDTSCLPPRHPCSSLTEELLYLVQFDGLLNCEYAPAPDSCLAQSEMWWMGRRARRTYGNDQAWKEREILCAFVSLIPKPHKGICFFFLDCFCQRAQQRGHFLFPVNPYSCAIIPGT